MFDVDIVKEENRHTFEDMESSGAPVVVALFTRSLFDWSLAWGFTVVDFLDCLSVHITLFCNSLDSFISNWAQDLALLLTCIFGRGMGSGPDMLSVSFFCLGGVVCLT